MKTNSECRVLIIDDEKDLCMLLKTVCQKRGLVVHMTNSLTQASSKLEQNTELIFLDNNLPDGLGVEFISKIRDQTHHACIIMMTAENSTAVKEKAFESGADYFLSKPFDLAVVNLLIDRIAC